MLNQEVILEDETAAVQIPGGNGLMLPEGSRIYITQMHSRTITAASDLGLVRITKEEAIRAKILPPDEEKPVDAETESLPLEDKVWNALREVYDPEIPVNIVDLGLIYDVEIVEVPAQGAHVHVLMTLTAPGCGMGPHIMSEAECNIYEIPDVSEVDVEFVWDPPWNEAMMSEEARMILGTA